MIKPHYEPVHFGVREYVPPELYEEKGDRAILVMDDRILFTADGIRDHFGKPCIINNYHIGGQRKESGFREKPIGKANRSQHLYGRALDIIVVGVDACAVRKEILENQNAEAFQYITRMEDDASAPDWVHIDLANEYHTENGIILFKP